MKKIILIINCFLFFLTPSQAQNDLIDSEYYSVLVIPVSGTVDPGMAAYIGRAIKKNILKENDTIVINKSKILIILELDTFGGRVDAALQIVDTLSSLPRGQTIALVKKRAISAGSLIALACNKLFMKHNTTIGDCAPISFSNDGPKMLGEKFQSPLRAKFRALAKRNNYPSVLAESMVTADMTVYKIVMPDTILYIDSLGYENLTKSEKDKIKTMEVVVARGELLTMDDQEAHEYGFSKKSVENIEEILSILEISDYRIIRVEESWSEVFVRLIARIAPILMMIGFAALYTELKAPGFGLPGIIGILCLALVFGGQYIVGLANYTELLIIIIGIVLLASELFILPGFGILGLAGMAFIAVGMILSLQDFVLPKPEFPWQKELIQENITMMFITLLGSFILIVIFFKYLFPGLSKVISGPYLSATLSESKSNPEFSIPLSIGDKGIVNKTLRPSGSVKFGENVYDVVTEGEFVDKNETVIITEIRGNRIIVGRDISNDQ
jgi:membrane-bound serine protease (ClpP class)